MTGDVHSAKELMPWVSVPLKIQADQELSMPNSIVHQKSPSVPKHSA